MTTLPEALTRLLAAVALLTTKQPEQILASLADLRHSIDRLEYIVTPKPGAQIAPNTAIPHVQCSADGCKATSNSADNCLLYINSAWFCRAHHPARESGSVPAVGWTAPEAQQAELQQKRAAAWQRLSHDERKLLNRNIV